MLQDCPMLEEIECNHYMKDRPSDYTDEKKIINELRKFKKII